jgi:tRNA pseudouridine55 synthase
MRRAVRQSAIGHTGTLDPAATGLLVLVLGRATKLAQLLSGSDKTYEADIRLGFRTTTDDAEGTPLGSGAPIPDTTAIVSALDTFRGGYDQVPPAHSAKKIGGEKAYELARRDRPVELKAVPVTVRALECVDVAGALVRVRVTAGSGFYVRSLARDLGARLGCGGHLAALRRTGSGPFLVDEAVSLEDAERRGAGMAARVIAPADALPGLASVEVTEAGLRRAQHGNFLAPEHLVRPLGTGAPERDPVRILGPDGRLVALAHARGGVLHPMAVLG